MQGMLMCCQRQMQIGHGGDANNDHVHESSRIVINTPSMIVEPSTILLQPHVGSSLAGFLFLIGWLSSLDVFIRLFG